MHVGTTPRGKGNYAPVVRYVDDAEHVAAKAEATTKGRRLTKNQRHMIELVVRIETRDGRHYVPTPFLQERGYAAHMEAFSGRGDMPVSGVLVADLQQLAYSEDQNGTRGEDGRWTVFEAGRKRWEVPVDDQKRPLAPKECAQSRGTRGPNTAESSNRSWENRRTDRPQRGPGNKAGPGMDAP